MNIALHIGRKERYVFSKEEFIDLGLVHNGPSQLECWNRIVQDDNYLFSKLNRRVKYYFDTGLLPEGWTLSQILEMSGDHYGELYTIFSAIGNKPLNFITEAEVTYYLDDEKSAKEEPYTWQDNFQAEEWGRAIRNPSKIRDAGKMLMYRLGVKPSKKIITFDNDLISLD